MIFTRCKPVHTMQYVDLRLFTLSFVRFPRQHSMSDNILSPVSVNIEPLHFLLDTLSNPSVLFFSALLHQVPLDEAQSAAEAASCLLVEVSAAEGHSPIIEKLHGLFLDAVASLCHRGRTVKRRKSLFENVSKKLGSVFRMRSLEDSSSAAEVNKQKMMQVCHQIANRRSV